jgi:hypothetical protein
MCIPNYAIKVKKTNIGTNTWVSKRLKNSNNHLSNHWFFVGTFMETVGSLMVLTSLKFMVV